MDTKIEKKNPHTSSSFPKPESERNHTKKFGCRLRFPMYACSSVRKGKEEDEDEDEYEREEKKEIRVVSMRSVKEVKREEDEEEQRSDRLLLEHKFSEQSSSKVSASSEKDQSLNLGMGVGLMLLLSKSTTELNKMVELRKEMETLLTDIKTEIQKKKNEPTSSENSNNTAPVSFTISEGNENSSDSVLRDNCEFNKFESKLDQVVNERDEMEAELEVELERLHYSMEGKNSLQTLPPLRINQMETSNEINQFTDSFSDASDEYNKIYEQQHEYIYEQQLEEEKQEDEDEQNYNNYEGGVCPFELERRLLDVQEMRQRERIEELEFALEFAERKLHEKDREICWWRDTAKLVTQHKDDPHFR
ncbi:hypothetical protein LUZ60_000819 [Juncus effusus]|nr:hypothetical protein LUZ60_000819 [Juncus effusus]